MKKLHVPAANARAAGTGTPSWGRRSRPVKIVELIADQARPILRAFTAEVPVGVVFAKRSGMLAGRIAVFRFDRSRRSDQS